MMNRIATFFSVIFHPIFMMLWYLLYLYLVLNVNFGASFYSVIVLFSAIIPIVAILIGHATKIISSYQMQERKDRYFIYAITIISYFVILYYMWYVDGFSFMHPLSKIIFGGTISLILVSIINFFWKISIHMSGAGALFASFILTMGSCGLVRITELVVCVAIASVVGWARMQLDSHTLSQVISGWFVGLCPQLLLYVLF